MIFPLQQKENVPLRNHNEFFQNGKEGTEKNANNGCNGASLTTELISIQGGLPLDFLHLVFAGILKQLGKKWLNDTKSPYYIGKQKAINCFIILIYFIIH
jgi:hypothetical protein